MLFSWTLLIAVLAATQTHSLVIDDPCGGVGWAGPTHCPSGSGCYCLNIYYWQCKPLSYIATAPNLCSPTPTTTRTSASITPSSTGASTSSSIPTSSS
ncbi:hypothetical protein M408DRAFT_331246 [Serendipita vermifera MAFF 305830]|uniref:CBM1 domain-containing protein n=1 Tax=Serendipita vermifera MAFF 305830 TaxID=933852 RepID=A0A0C2X7R8_SERVB|nr:hypothetical protein M408DRAFT_331246 [Serendipita vermifera MAFF 305830]